MRGARIAAVAALVIASALGRTASGQGARYADAADPVGLPESEMEVRLIPDLAFTASMLGVALLLERSKETWAGDSSCDDGPPVEGVCRAETINFADRWVAGVAVDGASSLSDVLLGGLLLSPLAFAGIDGFRDPGFGSPGGERFGRDALVISQTYAATYLATNLIKVSVKRLRPFNYDRRFLADRREGDARASFPSGHASMSFAAAATLSVMLEQRHPGEGWAFGVSAAAFATAAGVATLRVLAARHFPSDVLVGAALGTTIGILVPRFHRGRGDTPARSEPAFITIGGTF